MAIIFDEKLQLFHLQAANTSYMMKIYRDGYFAHIYWGNKLRNAENYAEIPEVERAWGAHPNSDDRTLTLDCVPQEYPAYGTSDNRNPAYHIQLENGSTISDLRYSSHKILKGKPALEGLPSTYVESLEEAETIEITLTDSLIKLDVILTYTVYEKLNVITRSVKYINSGNEKLKLLKVLSANVDFKNDNFDLLHLSGSWARERHMIRTSLRPGIQSIESRRGASSAQQNPFIALLSKDATETNGDVYGFNLVYSGNFVAEVEVDQFFTTRVNMGINDFDFSWLLEQGQSFQAPEVVMVYSGKGLGEMSRTYHKLYRTRLCRGQFRDKERPILANNWEATFFKFNADKIKAIAKAGKEVGIELFVLDDGWFGKRDADNSSLGDWVVDRNKLPAGLVQLAKDITSYGMEFGLWVEPEMISPNSDLYRSHPNWCLHVPDRRRTEGRNQLILDLSRVEVCDYVIKSISDVLKSAKITYVKWDMNRNMTEIGSACLPAERQRETAHRYILGLYRIMGEITSAFPHILFESCSGGGGRFDPGILYYMPQTWTSDDTDAVERLKIQYGTTVVYPTSAMCCHISEVPNGQTERVTNMDMRCNVAMSGNFGYEFDLTTMGEEDKDVIRKQIEQYKEVRSLIQFGDFYRLLSPFEGNETAWMFVSEEKKEAFAAYFRVLGRPNSPFIWVKLQGLNPNYDYRLIGTGKVYGGDELMQAGVGLPYVLGDFYSQTWRFEAIF
ncbi:alpha-galactosidase [Clostridium vincentii]|uniref:Alpha-galactosidase n=1 Tax=Clostridium vincentii TaxID=52704 RepID=A0A2T0BGF7_9CLOT|nr:alpha-galactosidase [Clostridium vincentii]PRR83001.1 Alpha-galactosidase [Clostridium vincentii]